MSKKIISEQLPSDGSFRIHKYLDEANERLGKLGKHGKRCKLKRSGNCISLQFQFGKQKQKGSGCSFSRDGIREAEKIAAMVTNQLVANQYSDEWLNSLLGRKKPNEAKKKLTCAEMIVEYKTYWFEENKKLKTPNKSWYKRFHYVEEVFSTSDDFVTEKIIRQVIEKTEKDTPTRTYTLQTLRLLLEYFSLTSFNKLIDHFARRNKPLSKNKYVPNDSEIMTIYNLGFQPKLTCPKKYLAQYKRWQFLYGLLATYGLRIHEAWSIANWNSPVILKDGDWVEVGLDIDDETNKDSLIDRYRSKGGIVPAIGDPSNTRHILAIKHSTKTGYRMAIPLSPKNHNWLEEFKLIGELNLPSFETPLGYNADSTGSYNCTIGTCRWFLRHKYGFTPHALRHAYNHRAHQQGFDPVEIADSLGHSIAINQGTYLKSRSINRRIEMANKTADKAKNKQSEIEKLKAENEYLKAENEKLRTELKLYEALKDKL